MNRNSVWMAISGLTGFLFFLVANFVKLPAGSNVLVGCLQLCINAFIFVVWLAGFRQSRGFKRFIAWFGVVIPFVLASITLWRVILPAILAF